MINPLSMKKGKLIVLNIQMRRKNMERYGALGHGYSFWSYLVHFSLTESTYRWSTSLCPPSEVNYTFQREHYNGLLMRISWVTEDFFFWADEFQT
ncbi:hypothetical protein NSS94_03240 [Paenibacillus sp. FSL L8-0644]|uniref:hypothetical protein n=1 Tax=Paenibacillus sp. FSL L8-0644 TaxID=2954523 RepID=UPI0030FC931E